MRYGEARSSITKEAIYILAYPSHKADWEAVDHPASSPLATPGHHGPQSVWYRGWEQGLWSQTVWIQILGLSLYNFVTPNRPLNLPVPQFLSL